MAESKRKALKKQVFAYHLKNPDVPYYEYHKKNPNFPKHHNTIAKYIEEMKGLEENQEKIKVTYQKRIEEENNKVFDYISNDTEDTIEALRLMKKALKDKASKAIDDSFTNIKDIAVAYGIVIEKEIAIGDHAIKLKKFELEKRALDLKEKELMVKSNYAANIENNIGAILELVNTSVRMDIDPMQEIKEFTQ